MQPDVSEVEANSISKLTRWLSAFVETATRRQATELEALDDPRGMELLLPASCLMRDSSADFAVRKRPSCRHVWPFTSEHELHLHQSHEFQACMELMNSEKLQRTS